MNTTKNLLIATSKAPSRANFASFVEAVRDAGKDDNVSVGPVALHDGPGCANLVLSVTGTEEDFERYANGLTMAMMPARWTTTEDTIEEGYHLTK
jgi:hypothetical protein